MFAKSPKILTCLALLASASIGGCGGYYSDQDSRIEEKFIVSAGGNFTLESGEAVRVVGVARHPKKDLTYKWTQQSGPQVTLSVWYKEMSFTAPLVSVKTELKFRFTATTSSGKSKSDDVKVTVEPASVALYGQGEVEPNGLPQTANALLFPAQVSLERVVANISGSVNGADGDGEDYFIFTPPTSGDYLVSLCDGSDACQRGTVTEDFMLVVYDQALNSIADTCCVQTEQSMSLRLSAGLPYYVGIVSQDPNLEHWKYNLTIISD